MTTQMARPRGRRPGHDDTRGTIARSAETLFTQHGYEATSLRGIARDAGVDPALVHHYFTSKSQLFSCVMLGASTDLAAHLRTAVEGEGADVAARLAQAFLTWCDERDSSVDQAGHDRRLLQEYLAREVLHPGLTVDGPHPLARAQLAAGVLVGVLDGRYLAGRGGLATTPSAQLVGYVAASLRALL